MPKLTRESLTLIKNRLGYYSSGEEVEDFCSALGLPEFPEELGDRMRDNVAPVLNRQIDEGRSTNLAEAMCSFIDMVLKHSNSDEELFLSLTIGWASLAQTIHDHHKKEMIRKMLGDILQDE